jgi:hypothetical protein
MTVVLHEHHVQPVPDAMIIDTSYQSFMLARDPMQTEPDEGCQVVCMRYDPRNRGTLGQRPLLTALATQPSNVHLRRLLCRMQRPRR